MFFSRTIRICSTKYCLHKAFLGEGDSVYSNEESRRFQKEITVGKKGKWIPD